ncbi:bacteriocin-like protein [Chryseobacterium artocarpi]|uniref:bacteriocin-like protein n=1 Tax=Chryseobacterium artocarpi TaxID=1414727 RepID=UPI003F2B8A50
MKNSKKIKRENLKAINGGGIWDCNENCPEGPYGPDQPKSCAEFHSLPECCKRRVLVSMECFEPF